MSDNVCPICGKPESTYQIEEDGPILHSHMIPWGKEGAEVHTSNEGTGETIVVRLNFSTGKKVKYAFRLSSVN